MPDSSGVSDLPFIESGRFLADWSLISMMPRLACWPGRSSGRAVRMSMVAPRPPVGMFARLVLKTSTSEIALEDRFAKSKEREPDAPVSRMLAPGICRPFNSTRL